MVSHQEALFCRIRHLLKQAAPVFMFHSVLHVVLYGLCHDGVRDFRALEPLNKEFVNGKTLPWGFRLRREVSGIKDGVAATIVAAAPLLRR
jgi:hypothetical protein